MIDYHLWADEKVISSLTEISEKDFTKTSDDVRSIRDLVEHHITGYDYLIISSDKLENRIQSLTELSRRDLLDNWENSRNEFKKKALGLDDMVDLPISKDKSLTMDKDNYVLLYTDHLTYHRAQLTQTIKMRGYKGPNTDYYSFVAEN
ncbi:MAG: hypothetical protein HeimC2_02140 [Candidatus Heimdallarchaeota archaeon LC_2]|nr:MAG: hypothetical protein HeimC2_02140 [Candidatus Heimdallarchaeota archaeon LC_2]